MPRKKSPKAKPVKRSRRKPLKVATHEERVEHFAEEMGRIGERFAGRSRTGGKRLYRSGKERILGGVCGGIGEYLEVDPVIIRLLWIVGCLAWGAGILLYIIAWIIIPRNPGHKW